MTLTQTFRRWPLTGKLTGRWRTLVSLAAGVAVAATSQALGRSRLGAGVDWAGLLMYLCGVAIAAMQADRLLHGSQL